MKLPLVDEIREARRLSEESAAATRDISDLMTALTSLDLASSAALPGDEVLRRVQDRWPVYLGEPAPRADDRRDQLLEALAALQPISDAHPERAHHMGHLQEEQQEALKAPQYAEVVAELLAAGAERTAATHAMARLVGRVRLIDPLQTLLERFLASLDTEVAGLQATADPRGIRAYRLQSVLTSYLHGVVQTLASLGLDVDVPELLPPHRERGREEVLAEAATVRAWCVDLNARADAVRRPMEQDLTAQRATIERVDRSLRETLG